MTENGISQIIVDAAIEVHRELGGPGLLEGVYEEALNEELCRRVVNGLPEDLNWNAKAQRRRDAKEDEM